MNRLREYDGRNVMTIEYNGRFIGYFSVSFNQLRIGTGDDTWDNSIIGYKNDDNKVNILLKRYFYQWIEDSDDDIYNIRYFEIEFTEINNNIVYSIKEINSINLTGYYINEDISIMYIGTVDLMREPSFYSKSYGTLDFNDNEYIRLLAIGDTRETLDYRNDFWYNIDVAREMDYWVHGYYVFFWSSIEIRD